MDNSLVHIPVSKFLSGLCRVLIVDSAVFLLKLIWSLYHIAKGLSEKNSPNSQTDYLARLLFGIFLLILVLLRFITNRLLYKDASNTLKTDAPSSNNQLCGKIISLFTTWILVSSLNIIFSLIGLILVENFPLWLSILIVAWEMVALLLASFFKFIIYRHYAQRSPDQLRVL